MATYTLRPNGDDKADWTEEPAGTAYTTLDDAVTSPTTPTLTDYITSSDSSSQICRLTFESVTLSSETVVGIRAFFYGVLTDSSTVSVSLRQATGTPADLATVIVDASDLPSAAWYELRTLGPVTQAQLDAIQLSFNKSGVGDATIYACYLEVATRTDVWQTANNKFLANRNADTGLSSAAGWFAGDAVASADLGAGRSFLTFADSMWATAAGQEMTFWDNPNVGAGGRATFLRNTVATMSSYDVDAATFTFYDDGAVSEYFPDTTVGGTTVARWPFNTFVYNSRLWVVGFLNDSGINALAGWAAYCDDYSLTPDNWSWTYLDPMVPDNAKVCLPTAGFVDGGDGWVYIWGQGHVIPTPVQPSGYRVDADNFHAGDWEGGEWWTGSTWSRDKPGILSMLPPGPIGRRKPRGNIVDFTLNGPGEMYSQPSVTVNQNSKYQLTGIFDHGWTYGSPTTLHSDPPYHISYALTPSTTIAKMTSLTDEFELPDGENWCYQAYHHPQLTWTGAGADDQVWTYSVNNIDSIDTWGAVYHPRFVKATSIT